MKTYLFFDLDGTLTDPELGITTCVQYALASFGIDVADRKLLRPFIGPPLKESFMHYYGLSEADADSAIAKYRERFSSIGLYENKVYQGIPEVLSLLSSRGQILCVSTSKPTCYAQQILEHFQLLDYFTHICGSNLDGSRVKKGEVIAYTLEQCGNPAPCQVKMIGDRKHDILGARQNQLSSIGVLYGYGSAEELQNAGADALAKTPQDLELLCLF